MRRGQEERPWWPKSLVLPSMENSPEENQAIYRQNCTITLQLLNQLHLLPTQIAKAVLVEFAKLVKVVGSNIPTFEHAAIVSFLSHCDNVASTVLQHGFRVARDCRPPAIEIVDVEGEPKNFLSDPSFPHSRDNLLHLMYGIGVDTRAVMKS